MKTKSILALSILLLILSLTKSFAATYTFTGTGDWSDVALWDTYPGITINSGDMVVISTGSQCLLEGSLANNGTIENHGVTDKSWGVTLKFLILRIKNNARLKC